MRTTSFAVRVWRGVWRCCRLLALVGPLAVACPLVSVALEPLEPGAYAGSEDCAACHAQIFQRWRATRFAVNLGVAVGTPPYGRAAWSA